MLTHSFEDGPPLSTGPERVELAIERELRSGATRSELRALVERFSDLSRLIGIPLGDALARLDAAATRAAAGAPVDDAMAAVGDSMADRRAMMTRWCSARYQRAD